MAIHRWCSYRCKSTYNSSYDYRVYSFYRKSRVSMIYKWRTTIKRPRRVMVYDIVRVVIRLHVSRGTVLVKNDTFSKLIRTCDATTPSPFSLPPCSGEKPSIEHDVRACGPIAFIKAQCHRTRYLRPPCTLTYSLEVSATSIENRSRRVSPQRVS